MGLVYTNQSDASLDSLHHLYKTFVVQSLRRAIQETKLSFAKRIIDLLQLRPGLGGVHAFCRDALLFEGVNLILHQSNQRRHHNGDARVAFISLFALAINLLEGNRGNLE